MPVHDYDVVIVGAGPAGGECARELSQRGIHVLLTDRMQHFSINAYSSAGAPNAILSDYQLPQDVVGTTWNTFMIHSSKNRLVLKAESPRGVVMDFAKLRAFLAHETEKHGGSVKLGYAYCGHSITDKGVLATFKTKKGDLVKLQAKFLVDATGSDRQVLSKAFPKQSFPSTGIEYLVEVPEETYAKWSKSLSFFMGHRWMPQGYAWIFPMEPGRLKVGVIRYFQNENIVPCKKSYQYYLQTMMRECLGSDALPIIDRHGKTVHYTYRQQEPHFQGPVVAIGDSVSTINPLAFEGIRHAMASARIASKHLEKKLDNPGHSFKAYQKELKKYYGYKWRMSEWLMRRIYRSQSDEAIEKMLRAYRGLTFDEVFDLGFHYRFRPGLKFLWNLAKGS